METTSTLEDRTCGACKQVFDDELQVFSHPCPGLPEHITTRVATRPGDNVDPPEFTGQGGRSYKQLDRSNRYGGSCVKCDGYVPAGEGWLVKDNSKQRGGTAWGVVHKIGQCVEASAEPAAEAPKPSGISEAQEKFLRSLLDRKQHDITDVDGAIAALNELPNPRQGASALIDHLKRQPDAIKPDRLEDGIYLVDGTVYKVYHTKHGANQQVAKELVIDYEHEQWLLTNPDYEGTRPGRFEYKGKAPLRKIQPEHRMTLEQAKEFGAVYGMCCSCGATLTDETSIEQGIGPVCAKRFA